jgi:hypothetical protein
MTFINSFAFLFSLGLEKSPIHVFLGSYRPCFFNGRNHGKLLPFKDEKEI